MTPESALLTRPAPPRDAPDWTHPDPYLAGNYTPIQTESHVEDLEVIGELPSDLDGVFVRTGSNPRFEPLGRYHWFDGDGMLHAVQIANGEATYRNRWVRTEGFASESTERRALWKGLLEPPDLARAGGPYKDTANTDLTWHNGRLYATWWLSGAAYEIDPLTLETVGANDFGGTLQGSVAAHPKVDPRTDEMRFIGYAPFPPYLRMGVVSPDGRVAHEEPIDLPGPRLQHDMAITEHHTLLFDFSMQPDLARGGRTTMFRDIPTRIGVAPTRGTSADVRWFDADPCFVYHFVNAWEEGDEIVLVGCRITDPVANDPLNAATDRVVPTIAHLRLDPTFHEWRIDLRTGSVRERPLDDRAAEFPRTNDNWLGRRSRLSWHPLIAPEPTLLFEGFARIDIEGDTSAEHRYLPGWYGGETAFAPATGGTAEDDGYVITFVAEESSGRSELQVFDARGINGGPVARVMIPSRVPTGYHTEWIPGEDLP